MSQPSIFRKAAGPIVVRGEINLTDEEETPLNTDRDFLCAVVESRKTCPFAMEHTSPNSCGVVLNGIIFRPLLVVGENKPT